MNALKQLDTWHKTRTGLLVFGLFELGSAYGFFALAVNSGSLWQWTLTLILTVGGLRNMFLAVRTKQKQERRT